MESARPKGWRRSTGRARDRGGGASLVAHERIHATYEYASNSRRTACMGYVACAHSRGCPMQCSARLVRPVRQCQGVLWWAPAWTGGRGAQAPRRAWDIYVHFAELSSNSPIWALLGPASFLTPSFTVRVPDECQNPRRQSRQQSKSPVEERVGFRWTLPTPGCTAITTGSRSLR